MEARTGLESVPDGAFLRETCRHSAGLAFLPQAGAKPPGRGEGRRRSPRLRANGDSGRGSRPCRSTTWTAEYRCYTEKARRESHENRNGSRRHETWMEPLATSENALDRARSGGDLGLVSDHSPPVTLLDSNSTTDLAAGPSVEGPPV